MDNYIMNKIEELDRRGETWKAEMLLQAYCSGEMVTDAYGLIEPKWQVLLDRWANA